MTTTQISIDKFMELWNNVQNKDWDKVAPKLIENIQDTWQSELMTMFNELKTNMSYGSITKDDLVAFASSLQQPIKNTGYGGTSKRAMQASKLYVKKYPNIYVKSGELMGKMGSPYTFRPRVKTNIRGVKVRIPMKTEFEVPSERAKVLVGTKRGLKTTGLRRSIGGDIYNIKDTYVYLEERRSYLKSSFLRAWPKILKKLMESVGT